MFIPTNSLTSATMDALTGANDVPDNSNVRFRVSLLPFTLLNAVESTDALFINLVDGEQRDIDAEHFAAMAIVDASISQWDGTMDANL